MCSRPNRQRFRPHHLQLSNNRLNTSQRPANPPAPTPSKLKKDESAAAKVLEARINGTPLEALCGHVWVPSRDPKQLPMCQACKEIYEMYRGFNDELNEQPAE
ncbi:MAG: DUF3039 domain-containing protein [Acidimicrobiaceae bacterium]